MANTYTTALGDRWDTIAYTEMGSDAFEDVLELIYANEKYSDIAIFPAGYILTIPEALANSTETLTIPSMAT